MTEAQFNIVKFFQRLQPDHKALAKAFKEDPKKIDMAYRSVAYEDYQIISGLQGTQTYPPK